MLRRGDRPRLSSVRETWIPVPYVSGYQHAQEEPEPDMGTTAAYLFAHHAPRYVETIATEHSRGID